MQVIDRRINEALCKDNLMSADADTFMKPFARIT